MQQAVSVRIHEAVRGLDRNVHNPLLHCICCTFIQRPIHNPVPKTSTVHPFRENRRNTADIPDIIAGDDAGMQTQVDPVLTFPDEVLLALPASFRKKSGLRALHGQIYVPAFMMDTPHTAHAS